MFEEGNLDTDDFQLWAESEGLNFTFLHLLFLKSCWKWIDLKGFDLFMQVK